MNECIFFHNIYYQIEQKTINLQFDVNLNNILFKFDAIWAYIGNLEYSRCEENTGPTNGTSKTHRETLKNKKESFIWRMPHLFGTIFTIFLLKYTSI